MLNEYVVDDSGEQWRSFKRENKGDLHVRVLLGGENDGPEAVHAYQPNSTAPPHFHLGAQFQLVLGGEAKYPDHTIKAIGVHYTDHNRPYGPFDCSTDYQHLVIHAKPAGQIDMKDPDAREQANPAGREIAASAEDIEWEASPEVAGARRKVLIGEASGLRVEVIEAPAGAEIEAGPAPHGRYDVVVEGSATIGGQEVKNSNLRYFQGDEAPGSMVCGPEGATIVMLQYDEDASKAYGGSITKRLVELEAENEAAIGG